MARASDASPGRCSGRAPLGRDPGEDPGHAGGIMFPDWPGNASVSPRRSRRGKSGHLCLDCCPRDPAPDERKKMDIKLMASDL